MQRWPRWVYGVGEEPDCRFSMANERTLLAGLRTSLALLAAGVAERALDLALHPLLQTTLSLVLVLLGMLLAGASWWRWARSERAMRLAEPLPATLVAAVVALGVLTVGVLLLVAFVA